MGSKLPFRQRQFSPVMAAGEFQRKPDRFPRNLLQKQQHGAIGHREVDGMYRLRLMSSAPSASTCRSSVSGRPKPASDWPVETSHVRQMRSCHAPLAVLLPKEQTHGKTHLFTAPGYTACERGITVRFTRVIDMINRLTAAPGDRLLYPRRMNSS
jgi:hypothetical protein